MRKKSLSTLLAWAFAAPESAQNTEPNGWDLQGSAGPKTGASSAGAMSVSVAQEGGTIQDGSTNKGRSTNAVTERGQAPRTEIAVGTAIADRPPHRSVRAELPHTAPTLDEDD